MIKIFIIPIGIIIFTIVTYFIQELRAKNK